MGIELLAAGLGTMVAAGAGALGSKLLSGGKMPSVPAAAVAAPEKPPQATKAPARPAIQASNMAAALPSGALAGNSSTFLTGPSGIDSSALSLGRNTLLGQ